VEREVLVIDSVRELAAHRRQNRVIRVDGCRSARPGRLIHGGDAVRAKLKNARHIPRVDPEILTVAPLEHRDARRPVGARVELSGKVEIAPEVEERDHRLTEQIPIHRESRTLRETRTNLRDRQPRSFGIRLPVDGKRRIGDLPDVLKRPRIRPVLRFGPVRVFREVEATLYLSLIQNDNSARTQYGVVHKHNVPASYDFGTEIRYALAF